jgi:hypothetical protein
VAPQTGRYPNFFYLKQVSGSIYLCILEGIGDLWYNGGNFMCLFMSEKSPNHSPQVVSKVALHSWTYYLENPHKLPSNFDDENEKKELIVAFRADFHDLMAVESNQVDVDHVERMNQNAECLRQLDEQIFDEYKPIVTLFFEQLVEKDIQRWNKSEAVDLDEIDVRIRTVYKAKEGFRSDEEFSRFCNRLIFEIAARMEDYIDGGKANLDSYVNEKLSDLFPKEEAHLDGDYAAEMEATFGLFVLEGKIKVETTSAVKKYYFEVDGEKWRLELVTGKSAGAQLVAVVLDSDPKVSYIFDFSGGSRLRRNLEETRMDYLNGGIKLDFWEDYAKEARENFERQAKNRDMLKQYDLPSDQPIYRLSVFHDYFDETVVKTLHSAVLLNYALKKRYPNMEIAPLLFNDKPKVEITDQVKAAYDNGVRYFSIDIRDHGDPDGFGFRVGKGLDALQFGAADFLELFNKFPDAHFQINTIACHGAGLRVKLMGALYLKKVRKEQFSLFVQTKPDVVNIISKVKNGKGGNSYSTYYELHFLRALLEGKKSYGEAVDEADEKAKEDLYLDAESIIDGHLISMNSSTYDDSAKAV